MIKLPRVDPIYFEAGFCEYVSRHRELLKQASTDVRNLTIEETEQWEGDFYGMLTRLKGISPDQWWATALINDIHLTSDFDGEPFDLRVADLTYLNKLKNQYKLNQ